MRLVTITKSHIHKAFFKHALQILSGAREPLSVSELCVCEYTCSVSASNERSDETERTTGVGTKSPMFEQINKGLPDVYQLDGLISKFSIYLFISFHFQLKLM